MWLGRLSVHRLTSTRMIHPYQKCPYQVLYNIIAFSDFHYMLQDILSVRCLKRIFQPKVFEEIKSFSKPNQPRRKKTSLYFILMDYHNCLPLKDSLFDVFRDTVFSKGISVTIKYGFYQTSCYFTIFLSCVVLLKFLNCRLL